MKTSIIVLIALCTSFVIPTASADNTNTATEFQIFRYRTAAGVGKEVTISLKGGKLVTDSIWDCDYSFAGRSMSVMCGLPGRPTTVVSTSVSCSDTQHYDTSHITLVDEGKDMRNAGRTVGDLFTLSCGLTRVKW